MKKLGPKEVEWFVSRPGKSHHRGPGLFNSVLGPVLCVRHWVAALRCCRPGQVDRWRLQQGKCHDGQVQHLTGGQRNSRFLRSFFFFFLIYLFLYLFMTVLGLRFCARAFSRCGERGPLFIAVRGPLTIASSLVAEHRLQTRRLSSCGSRA